ncbi:MAG: hypothetical protein WAQ05_21175 [Rubrivivax sp.]
MPDGIDNANVPSLAVTVCAMPDAHFTATLAPDMAVSVAAVPCRSRLGDADPPPQAARMQAAAKAMMEARPLRQSFI